MLLAVVFLLATKAKAQTLPDSVKIEYQSYKPDTSTKNEYTGYQPVSKNSILYKDYNSYKPVVINTPPIGKPSVILNPFDNYMVRQKNMKKLGAVVTSGLIILIVDFLHNNNKI